MTAPQSIEEFVDGDDVALPGRCTAITATVQSIKRVETFDLQTLGFTPPFHVE